MNYQRNQQSQVYAQANIQQQNEISYTLNQDLQNMLGVALEFYAVEQNSKFLNPDLVKVQKNRLILQYNLSNGIHLDLQSQLKSSDQRTFFKNKKADNREKFANIFNQLRKGMPEFIESDAYQLLKDYENNLLKDEVWLNQKIPEEVNVEGRFDEQVLQKIVGSIQQNNQIYSEINNSKTPIKEDNSDKILEKAMIRFQAANLKLQNRQTRDRNDQEQAFDQTYPQSFRILFGGLFHYFKNVNSASAQIMLQFIRIHLNLMQSDTKNKQENRSLLGKLKNKLSNLYYFCDQFIKFLDSGKEEQNPFVALTKINLSQKELNFLEGYVKITEQFWEAKRSNALKLHQEFLSRLLLIYKNEPCQCNYQIEDQYDLYYLAALINDQSTKLKSPFLQEELRKQYHQLFQSKQKNDQQEEMDIKQIQQDLEKINSIMV